MAGQPVRAPATDSRPPDGSANTVRAAARCLALDVLARQTIQVLTSADIPAVLIKGPATAHRLYPDQPDQRTYTDVDILVPVYRFADAENALRGNGYQSLLTGIRDGEFPWHETAWRRTATPGLTVDLHRSFSGVTQPAAFFEAVWESRAEHELLGAAVFVPGPAATALILMLHAASPGRNHKPLSDIRRSQEIFTPADWQRAAEFAHRCGAESSCRAGLGLLPDGLQFADSLGLSGVVTADKWLAGRQRDRISVNLALALDEPVWRATGAHVLRRVFPSPAFVRLFDPSIGPGRRAMAAAYLRRVERVITTLPLAMSDLAAARRATRPSGRRPVWVRAVQRGDLASLRAAGWAWRAHRRVRKQLRRNGLNGLEIQGPPTVRPLDRTAVRTVLRALHATCLERSLVLQRFDAAAGHPRAVVIAVTAPGAAFQAHAWLEGAAPPNGALLEIYRCPAPESCLP